MERISQEMSVMAGLWDEMGRRTLVYYDVTQAAAAPMVDATMETKLCQDIT
jgi:hypothetical protein